MPTFGVPLSKPFVVLKVMPGGKARQYMFLQSVKSAILKPSFGMNMQGPGLYEISGLAWSGAGRIAKVELSADGGKSWAPAVLNEPVLPKSLTRFRLAWQWLAAGQRSWPEALRQKSASPPAGLSRGAVRRR